MTGPPERNWDRMLTPRYAYRCLAWRRNSSFTLVNRGGLHHQVYWRLALPEPVPFRCLAGSIEAIFGSRAHCYICRKRAKAQLRALEMTANAYEAP
jgi:hypothetical protein